MKYYGLSRNDQALMNYKWLLMIIKDYNGFLNILTIIKDYVEKLRIINDY